MVILGVLGVTVNVYHPDDDHGFDDDDQPFGFDHYVFDDDDQPCDLQELPGMRL